MTTSARLSVRIVNGNLRFVRQALLVGHYRSKALTGAERVVDIALGGDMHRELELGSYPQSVKQRQVFRNQNIDQESYSRLPLPFAAIVVGLGDENKIDAKQLTEAVCQGVLEWARERRKDRALRASPFEMAATLIGSGGARIGVGQSALLVVAGVQEANKRLTGQGLEGVSELGLVELYNDRAEEAWAALRERALLDGFDCTDCIVSGSAPLRRPLNAAYRGADYDLIAVAQQQQGDAQTLSFTFSTRRARTDVHGEAPQFAMVRQLLLQRAAAGLGRALFNYLFPLDLQPFLAASSAAVLELDTHTAAIPWELLDTNDGSSKPWAINAKVVRKLRTPELSAEVEYASPDGHALVIGEPQSKYPRLPRAADEGRAVAARLTRTLGAARVRDLVRGEATPNGWSSADIVRTLFGGQEWRIIHVAGHGDLPEWNAANAGAGGVSLKGAPRGVVLSDNCYLGQTEFRQLKRVPELVFINCCYLGDQGGAQVGAVVDPRDQRYDRVRWASSLAESIIATGVRCVIAAGWAVDDEPARRFATTFYDELQKGKRFMDATAAAREAAWTNDSDTWAAYQCYGDPDWRLERAGGLAPETPEERFPEMSSAQALLLTLETVTAEAHEAKAGDEEAARKNLAAILEHLENAFAPRWSKLGTVADAFGKAWADCDEGRAIDWYRRALAANDGGASMRAAEQVGNLGARRALRLAAEELAKATGSGDASARTAVIDRARSELTRALTLFGYLATINPTVERESLCGSTWKLFSRLEHLARDEAAARAAIVKMEEAYGRAAACVGEEDPDWFYPAQNRMIAELVLKAADPSWPGFPAGQVAAMKDILERRHAADPNFWTAAGLIELALYDALAGKRLAARWAALADEYETLHERVPVPRLWGSVRNQLEFVLPAIPSGAEQDAATRLLTKLRDYSRVSA